MDQPAPAYRGDQPYVFVCYAHQDKALVYPQITWLQEQGVNVWYDEGIAPGEEWSEELGQAINKAGNLIFFVTPKSVYSRHCRNEVHFAQNHQTPVLAVHLEKTELPAGLELALGSSQAVFAYDQSIHEWRPKVLKSLPQAGRPPPTDALTPKARGAGSRYWFAVSILLGAAVVLGVYLSSSTGSSQGSQSLDLSVSIAPLRIIGNGTDARIVSDNLLEGLKNLLTEYPEIDLVASAAGGAGLAKSARYVVSGSLQQTEDDIRFRARLLRNSDQQSVWSGDFRIELKPTGVSLDRVAANVGRFVRLEVAQDAQCEAVRQRSHSPEAARLFCLGWAENESLFQGGAVDPDLMRRAAERALELDPSLAEAHVLIMAYLNYAVYFDELSAQEASEQILSVAAQGLRLQPNNVAILSEKSRAHLMVRDLRAAEASAQRALSADPFHPYIRLIHDTLARIALYRGDLSTALDHYRKAVRIFDGDARIWVSYANTLRFAGLYEESIRAARVAVDLVDQGVFRMGAIRGLVDLHTSRGHYDKATEALGYINEIDKVELPGYYASVLAWSGRSSEARAVWEKARRAGSFLSAWEGFWYTTGMRDEDGAFEWLQKALDGFSELTVEYVRVDPSLEFLRQDPRWTEIVAQLDDAI